MSNTNIPRWLQSNIETSWSHAEHAHAVAWGITWTGHWCFHKGINSHDFAMASPLMVGLTIQSNKCCLNSTKLPANGTWLICSLTEETQREKKGLLQSLLAPFPPTLQVPRSACGTASATLPCRSAQASSRRQGSLCRGARGCEGLRGSIPRLAMPGAAARWSSALPAPCLNHLCWALLPPILEMLLGLRTGTCYFFLLQDIPVSTGYLY